MYKVWRWNCRILTERVNWSEVNDALSYTYIVPPAYWVSQHAIRRVVFLSFDGTTKLMYIFSVNCYVHRFVSLYFNWPIHWLKQISLFMLRDCESLVPKLNMRQNGLWLCRFSFHQWIPLSAICSIACSELGLLSPIYNRTLHVSWIMSNALAFPKRSKFCR